MRRLLLMALVVGGFAVPAAAQDQGLFTPVVANCSGCRQAVVNQRKEPQASPEAMVARLMSFDRNHDGVVSRDELPERMQPLLARIEVFTTGDGLDEKEVRRLAENPVAKPQVFVLQAGHYGFGDDNGFDTRLHIESAIEDLRLASATRDKALEIGMQFVEATNAKARADLIAALTPIFTAAQLRQIETALDRTVNITTSGPDDPSVAVAKKATIALLQRQLRAQAISMLISASALAPEHDGQAKAALEQFTAHNHLTDEDRTVLLAQMGTLLSDQERDDLRAALERRPIVKQGTLVRQ